MKKTLSLLLLFTLLFTTAFVSCGKDDTVINIGVMNGPTGMGMAPLMTDESYSEKYSFTSFSSPANATSALANGELDMLCVPTNLAANLASKQADYVSVIAINCLGSLYVVTDGTNKIESIADLAGKTVYIGEPTSTTPAIVNFLLEENGVKDSVNVEVLANNDLVSDKINNGEISIAILPEPKATATIITANKSDKVTNKYSIGLNLSTEWDKVSEQPLTMGCIIVSNKFLSEHKSVVNSFLEDYKNSIEYIGNSDNKDNAAKMIAEAKILPNETIAAKALTNLYGSITYIDGAEMKTALKGFYSAINQALIPEDDFYYEK